MKNYVITIGCEYGAKGNYIGRQVAKALGIRFYDRGTVDAIIDEVGIPKDIMEMVEAGKTIAGKGAPGEERGSFSKNADLTSRAIDVQKRIVKKLAAKESCVIIGRSADFILKDEENVLKIFIYASEEARLANIMEGHKLSEADAKLLMEQKDKRYHVRHKAFTGTYRGDRHNRDLLIDSGLLGADGTADYIVYLAKKMFDK